MNNTLSRRQILLGGMGVSISHWLLAKAVSQRDGAGTCTGVASEQVLAIALQRGDPGGHYRRALATFPFQQFSDMVLKAFFIEGGQRPGQRPRNIPMFDIAPSKLLIALRVCADYSMVWLAKEKNDGPIGMNYLDKIGIPHVYALVGAMLAGVDYLTVGAGIPDSFPIMIDAVLSGQLVKYPVPVSEIGRSTFHEMCFDPSGFFGENLPEMKRPAFFPVIASNLLAQVLLRMKKLQGKIDGFVIEGPTAGGHNAPPRDHEVDASGDPVYNERDVVNFRKIADYGLPFWIGGGIASPEKLRWAISEGAVGGQIGTAFAFCQESGMDPELRRRVARLAYEGKLKIRTSSLASPTGFPFKTVEGLDGTLTDPHIQVERACTRGALRTLFRKIDGSIGYRCPAEPVDIYVSKGGLHEDTAGRQCICNGLLATAGLGNSDFPKIVTSGDDLPRLMRALMNGPDDDYTVDKVFEYLAA